MLSYKSNERQVQKRRIHKARLTGLLTILFRGFSTAVNLATLPIMSKYLGVERFGLWLIFSTLITWVTVFDLGLANSLTNEIAISDGKEDRERARIATSNAIFLMLGITIIISIVFLLTYPRISWPSLFNVTSQLAQSDASSATLIFLIFFTIRIPISIAGRIYSAYQEGYYYQIWGLIGSLLSMIVLLTPSYFSFNFSQLLALLFAALILTDIFSLIHIFCFRRRWLLPQIKDFHFKISKQLLRSGIYFWVAQISAIAIFQTDLIIVSRLFGAAEVASYGIMLRLFTLVHYTSSSFVMPLWPAYSEAAARGDFSWIVKTFWKSIWISILWSVTSGLFFVISSEYLTRKWLGQDIAVPTDLAWSMFFTSIFLSLSQCIAALANGLGEVRIQALLGPISAICNIILSIILSSFLGTSGVSWATFICVLFFSLILVGKKTLSYLNDSEIRTCK